MISVTFTNEHGTATLSYCTQHIDAIDVASALVVYYHQLGCWNEGDYVTIIGEDGKEFTRYASLDAVQDDNG